MSPVSDDFAAWLDAYNAARARGLSKDDADEAADRAIEGKKCRGRRKTPKRKTTPRTRRQSKGSGRT